MILSMAATAQHNSQIVAARTSGLWCELLLGMLWKAIGLPQALAKQDQQNTSHAKPAKLVCKGVKAKPNAHTAKLNVMNERGNKIKRTLVFAS